MYTTYHLFPRDSMQDASAPLTGTFQSIMPAVDEILAILVSHANSDKPLSSVEASDAVAVKVSLAFA